MGFRVFTEPNDSVPYDRLLRIARHSEALGFEGFFRADSYGPSQGLPSPNDAWVTLAGLARETQRIRLGTLATMAVPRLPGPLAITVAQIDQISGGRMEFGLSAGSEDESDERYVALGRRFGMAREQLQILDGIWHTSPGKSFAFEGVHYAAKSSPTIPRPAQARIPIIVGANGHRRSLRLAALFGDELNFPFVSMADFQLRRERAREACYVIGRPPDSLAYSVTLVACCGSNVRDFHRRAATIGIHPETARSTGIAGLPRQAAETVRRWKDLGADRIYFHIRDIEDLDHLDLLASEVLPIVEPIKLASPF